MVSYNLVEEEEVNFINFKGINRQIKLMEGKLYKVLKIYHRTDMYVIDAINQVISNNIVRLTMTEIMINHALKVYLKNSNGNK